MYDHSRFSAPKSLTMGSPVDEPPGEFVCPLQPAGSRREAGFNLFAFCHTGLRLAPALALVVRSLQAGLFLVVALVATGGLGMDFAATERCRSNSGYGKNGCCESQSNKTHQCDPSGEAAVPRGVGPEWRLSHNRGGNNAASRSRATGKSTGYRALLRASCCYLSVFLTQRRFVLTKFDILSAIFRQSWPLLRANGIYLPLPGI
jgi:hypothetical protein